jgi:hypothetical protein
MIRGITVTSLLLIIAGSLGAPKAIAQEAAGKAIHYEISASWLGLTPGGTVQSNSNLVDFASDLGIDGMASQAGFGFLVRPSNRGGFFGEFIPYRFAGARTIARGFRFGGVSYPVNEPVTSAASLTYLSFGYHRNIIARRRLDVGLRAGASYISVNARATSPSAGSAEVNRDVLFPLAGIVTQYFPSLKRGFNLRSEVRGMTFGAYGGFIDVAGAIGFTLSPRMTLDAGYRAVNGDGHHDTRGAELNFRGPVVTFRLHDRRSEEAPKRRPVPPKG